MIPIRNPAFPFKIRAEPIEGSSGRTPGSPGTVTISVPRFRGQMGAGFCRIIGVKPDIDINLDAYGSFIWLQIDGKMTVRDIGAELGREFGKTVEPLYGRLAHFLSLLERNRLLTYINLPPKPPGKRGSRK